MSDLGVAVIIEDDADMRNLLEAVLNQAGFEVYSASGGREGVAVVRDKQPDVVTLDVGLPDIDGFEVLRRIRQFSTGYVVMLTGRTTESDLLSALQGGADDYIMKPFRPLELRARIAAMMRRPRKEPSRGHEGRSRQEARASAEVRHDEHILRHRGLTLDFRTRTAAVRGSALDLTRKEFDLLHELLRGGGAIRTKSDLVRVVRGEYPDDHLREADERAVEVHIGNLRRKLGEKHPEAPHWVQTVRGLGYRLTPAKGENRDV
ncbi:response regulator transcription factor [Arthrobacter sp. R1-13]